MFDAREASKREAKRRTYVFDVRWRCYVEWALICVWKAVLLLFERIPLCLVLRVKKALFTFIMSQCAELAAS